MDKTSMAFVCFASATVIAAAFVIYSWAIA